MVLRRGLKCTGGGYRPYLRGFGRTRFRDSGIRRSGQIAALCRDVGEFIDDLALEDVVQWYFSTQLGRRGLTNDHRGICRYLRRTWSPSWSFTDEEFEQGAAAWENPDWVEITVHSYSQRWGEYKRRTLPGVGHFVPREAPQATADAILELVHRGRHG